MTSTQSSPRPDGTSQERSPQPDEQLEEKSGEQPEEQSGEQPEEKVQKPESAAAEKPAGGARATMVYTMMRLGLFVSTFFVLTVLAWVGVIPEGIGKSNPLWLFALAILISAPLSLVLLRKQRDAMSEHLVPRVERASTKFKGRLDQNRGREDDDA